MSDISKRICPYCDTDGVYVRICMDCGNVIADETEADSYVAQLEAKIKVMDRYMGYVEISEKDRQFLYGDVE